MKTILITTLLAAALVATTPVMAKQGDQLPPGLQKKIERGEPLPPGWQKKLNYRTGDRFDPALLPYGEVRDLGDNRQEIEVEDQVYTIIKDTREIIDILGQ
ncbi:hypothetical protein [Marinobacter confluentis]|uniref:RcnB family protein n=1 Tax=Marinobacter confluentis TaxID=1697557 RepID=A0A4Z1BNH8_9GAMM|nr:hypothetical protein [Marinobacter confluentis]TGN38947.1 hypothetical protein E5Q11_14555 [Marinobacter confluentis]